jgi:hypothetical protein
MKAVPFDFEAGAFFGSLFTLEIVFVLSCLLETEEAVDWFLGVFLVIG